MRILNREIMIIPQMHNVPRIYFITSSKLNVSLLTIRTIFIWYTMRRYFPQRNPSDIAESSKMSGSLVWRIVLYAFTNSY